MIAIRILQFSQAIQFGSPSGCLSPADYDKEYKEDHKQDKKNGED